MKKIGINILALSLAVMFLLSFTGIRMLIHHCLSCDTTDVALFAFSDSGMDDMHMAHAGDMACHIDFEGEQAKSCCAGHADEHTGSCSDCCKTEVHYLKNDYHVAQERNEQRIEPALIAVLLPLINLRDIALPDVRNLKPQGCNTDPPKPVGRDFLVFAHQLKIAHSFTVSV